MCDTLGLIYNKRKESVVSMKGSMAQGDRSLSLSFIPRNGTVYCLSADNTDPSEMIRRKRKSR
jgi:hypothetical protein